MHFPLVHANGPAQSATQPSLSPHQYLPLDSYASDGQSQPHMPARPWAHIYIKDRSEYWSLEGAIHLHSVPTAFPQSPIAIMTRYTHRCELSNRASFRTASCQSKTSLDLDSSIKTAASVCNTQTEHCSAPAKLDILSCNSLRR